MPLIARSGVACPAAARPLTWQSLRSGHWPDLRKQPCCAGLNVNMSQPGAPVQATAHSARETGRRAPAPPCGAGQCGRRDGLLLGSCCSNAEACTETATCYDALDSPQRQGSCQTRRWDLRPSPQQSAGLSEGSRAGRCTSTAAMVCCICGSSARRARPGWMNPARRSLACAHRQQESSSICPTCGYGMSRPLSQACPFGSLWKPARAELQARVGLDMIRN